MIDQSVVVAWLFIEAGISEAVIGCFHREVQRPWESSLAIRFTIYGRCTHGRHEVLHLFISDAKCTLSLHFVRPLKRGAHGYTYPTGFSMTLLTPQIRESGALEFKISEIQNDVPSRIELLKIYTWSHYDES